MATVRPNIQDVAALAGVSKSLVSLALSGSPRVGADSRKRIFDAAEALSYRKNAAARTLVARRSKTIGVLVLDLHNPVFAEILDGVQDEMRRNGFTTMLVSGGEDPVLEQADIETLLQFQVDGLILISHRLAPDKLAAFAKEVPTVVVTRSDMQIPNMDVVSNDDVDGTELAIDHLVSLGHTRITYLSGGENPTSEARVQGYLKAMSRHKLQSEIRVVPAGLTDAAGYAAALIALGDNPTAIVVANDLAAMGAIAAAQDSGLNVPDDVSIVGYDGIAFGGLKNVNLTTVAQPLSQLGSLAALRLIERISEPKQPAQQIRVAAKLLIRGTTAVPKSKNL